MPAPPRLAVCESCGDQPSNLMPHHKRIREFLDREKLAYGVIAHPPAFSAQKAAAAAHLPGRQIAKTVIVKVDGKLAMVVVPADAAVDLKGLRQLTGADSAVLATEWEFKDRFPDCEAGAMPPFGNLYGMPVFIDEAIAHDEFITFPAGRHSEMVLFGGADYLRLVQPRVVRGVCAGGRRTSAFSPARTNG